jgi:hypothetical protein
MRSTYQGVLALGALQALIDLLKARDYRVRSDYSRASNRLL